MQSKQNQHPGQIKNLKSHLKKAKGDLLTSLLNLDCCQQIIKESRQFRERIYTPFQIIRSFIKQVVDADKSCSKAVISVAAERLSEGKTPISINTGPYVKARRRLPEETIPHLVSAVGKESLNTGLASWRFHGREIKLCDGTTVEMPDTKANKKVFPKHNNKKKMLVFLLLV